ncbi:transglycosylase domain-containing protein [Ahrensia marina]|uniref:biosynthetic peptidoglycan transglycosylase n=1 Tax=Ahrensia marina TaxID=1514904 RepID=UPI0035CF4F00
MGPSETRATGRAKRAKAAAKRRWRLPSLRGFAKRAIILFAALFVGLPVFLTLAYTVIPPVSTLMLRDLVLLRGYDRDWVTLDDVAAVLENSIIASEDQTFCSHNGVAWRDLRDQFDRWRAGEEARGASTLSMQVARNLFLWQGRSAFRKGLEVPLAVLIDTVWSKRRMMEVYINVAELGPQLYGFEAAAQRAFGSSTRDVSRRQAALLVATLPLPSQRDPANPTSRQLSLADVISSRAQRMGGYIECLALPEA